MLFTSCHDGVGGVPDVRGCTAIFGTIKSVHHITPIMFGFAGPCGEAGADFSGLVINYEFWVVVVDA